jgi:SAM-dependent methyltransferase
MPCGPRSLARLRRLRGPLSHAGAYSAFQRLLGARAVRREVVERHARVRPGERVLDLGCGPGDVLEELPDVTYMGVDASPQYVAAARRRWNGRGEFLQADVTSQGFPAGDFDVVLAIAVMHHLDDHGADRMLGAAAAALAPGGRLVTLDPALTPGQPRVARWLISRDRGAHARAPEGYRELAARRFESVTPTVRHDLARVPYTHAILECRDPRT